MRNVLYSPGAGDFVDGPLRYRRAPGARLSRGGEHEYFLKTSTGRLLVLGEREQFLWEAIDNVGSFEALKREFYSQFGTDLRPDDFAQFVSELTEAGALELLPQTEDEPERIRSTTKLRRVQLAETDVRDVAGGGHPEPDRLSPGQGFGVRRKIGGSRSDRARFKDFWSWPIGNPEKLFDALARVFRPIRGIFWLLIPLIIMAFLISVKHRAQYFADWSTLVVSISGLPCSWLAIHATLWSGRIVEGTVIHAYGGRVTRVNMRVFLGFLLLVNIDDSSVKSMTRNQQLWVTASPLLWRLFVFSISMIIWVMYRQSHGLVAQTALFMAIMGLITFVVSSCPLLPSNGSRFLSILLGQENLRRRAFRFLWLKIRGLPAPQTMSLAERWGLVLMAVGTAVITSLFIGHIIYSTNAYMITRFDGVGGIISLALLTACVLYCLALWRFAGTIRALHRADRGQNIAEDDPPARP